MNRQERKSTDMKTGITAKLATGLALVLTCLALYGCSSSVGVGLSVGVPIGNHGYISVGSNLWR